MPLLSLLMTHHYFSTTLRCHSRFYFIFSKIFAELCDISRISKKISFVFGTWRVRENSRKRIHEILWKSIKKTIKRSRTLNLFLLKLAINFLTSLSSTLFVESIFKSLTRIPKKNSIKKLKLFTTLSLVDEAFNLLFSFPYIFFHKKMRDEITLSLSCTQ